MRYLCLVHGVVAPSAMIPTALPATFNELWNATSAEHFPTSYLRLQIGLRKERFWDLFAQCLLDSKSKIRGGEADVLPRAPERSRRRSTPWDRSRGESRAGSRRARCAATTAAGNVHLRVMSYRDAPVHRRRPFCRRDSSSTTPGRAGQFLGTGGVDLCGGHR